MAMDTVSGHESATGTSFRRLANAGLTKSRCEPESNIARTETASTSPSGTQTDFHQRCQHDGADTEGTSDNTAPTRLLTSLSSDEWSPPDLRRTDE